MIVCRKGKYQENFILYAPDAQSEDDTIKQCQWNPTTFMLKCG